MSEPQSIDANKAAGFCYHGNIPSTCTQCQKENDVNLAKKDGGHIEKVGGIVHKETKDGLPVINSEEFQRMYNTDIRAFGENTSVTFDFQGFVKEDRKGYEDGHGTFYKDAMATNGILKANGHDGIHVGTDGIINHNETIGHRMSGPSEVGEYNIYIKIPSDLQGQKHCVTVNGSCIPEEEYYGDTEELEVARNSENLIVMRLSLDPKNDQLTRQKVQFIHAQIVRFIERGGPLYEIQNMVYDLESELEDLTVEEFEKRKQLTQSPR